MSGYPRPVNASATAQTAEDPYRSADAAAARLRELTGADSHDVALVMGSGWVPAADALGIPEHDIPITELPGFPPPAVPGHAGRIRSYELGDKRALVFLGRTHYYEGRGVSSVAHGVRTAVAAGCKTVVLTNGCGGLRDGMRPGQPVLISDHINMTAASPIVGPHFVDLTDLYSPRLRALCQEVDSTLEEGVYVQLPGPHYETPAEIGMVRAIGGDLVGMSTTLEAIAAREAGAEVLGISLVTNLAAGMTGEPLNHEEVLQAGRDSAARMGSLLAQVLGRI
jgi:purine-nucleoside phosphorylase